MAGETLTGAIVDTIETSSAAISIPSMKFVFFAILAALAISAVLVAIVDRNESKSTR